MNFLLLRSAETWKFRRRRTASQAFARTLRLEVTAAPRSSADPRRVIAEDLTHSENEKRFFCFGEVEGGILTVRFTDRGGVIRIFGAGH